VHKPLEVNMFRQILNKLATCMSSGFHIRCSPNNRFAALLDWRISRRSGETRTSKSTSPPETDWVLWLFHEYDVPYKPYPEA
jgi:hypothetical protein